MSTSTILCVDGDGSDGENCATKPNAELLPRRALSLLVVAMETSLLLLPSQAKSSLGRENKDRGREFGGLSLELAELILGASLLNPFQLDFF